MKGTTMTRRDPFYPPPQLDQPGEPPIVFAWAAQTPDDTELLLEELDLWVAWLVDRYRLDHRVVPDCWAHHPELIEELSALHLAWQDSFATTSRADAPLQWHEHFTAARERLNDWVARTGCRPDSHRPGGS